jgi:hypothetical protein
MVEKDDLKFYNKNTECVVDPDSYDFGPSGSGSTIICTDPDLDPDPSITKQK